MSKALRLGIVVLVLILVALGGIAVLALMQKQSLEGQLSSAQNQVADGQAKITELSTKILKFQQEIDGLNKQIATKSREAQDAQSTVSEAQRKADDLQAQYDQVARERDDWKSRIDTIRQERDNLVEKLKQQTELASREQKVQEIVKTEVAAAPAVTEAKGDEYWAGVIKQKAALQLELEKVKGDLDESALQIVELKKQNSDLQLQLKEIKDDKDEIERKIKYGEDLANNLSVELARARNDQKMTNDRADKLKDQNLQLQDQLRQLMTTKVALERTVAHLNGDKSNMQKKLAETENVIQGRINEIWQIKETLDQKISNMPNVPQPAAKAQTVELPPIIVNSGHGEAAPVAALASPAPTKTLKTQGNVLSINESNNFIITDLGQENSAVKVGNALKVMRDGKEIATLEVIQVRRDISAADIKHKNSAIKIGDMVQ